MFLSLFKKNKKKYSLPQGVRIYAVGDIHGRVDLLRKIHKNIQEDAKNFSGEKVVVYLGDYIDRGFRSKEVINELLENPLTTFQKIYLRGNHEYAILEFLKYPDKMGIWLNWGGNDCLQSYKVSLRTESGKVKPSFLLSQELRNKLPSEHLEFFNNLQLSYECGDYFFVHAGLRPEVEIENQDPLDMLTIRNEFVKSDYDFGKAIVFGHTVFNKPYNKNGRIGVDTGAYASGILSCAVIEGEEVKFLTSA